MNLSEIISNLKSEEKAKLMYALEHQLSSFVSLINNQYVGVNIVAPNFTKEITHGAWSYGKILTS